MTDFLGSIAQYFLAGFIGFFIGVVISCFLLAKKNIAMEKKIEAQVEASIKTAKQNYQAITEQKTVGYYEEEFDFTEDE